MLEKISLILLATIYLSLGYSIFQVVQTAQATGGGEVIELVIPMIDDATKAVQAGDNEKALALLEEIKTELKDTFFAEEEN
jgi:hypothetical protein